MSEAGKFLHAHQWSAHPQFSLRCLSCGSPSVHGHFEKCELAAILKEEFFDVQYAVPRE